MTLNGSKVTKCIKIWGGNWRSINFPGGSKFTHSSEEPLNRAKRDIPELRDIKGSALMYKYGTIWLYRHIGGITTTPLKQCYRF